MKYPNCIYTSAYNIIINTKYIGVIFVILLCMNYELWSEPKSPIVSKT